MESPQALSLRNRMVRYAGLAGGAFALFWAADGLHDKADRMAEPVPTTSPPAVETDSELQTTIFVDFPDSLSDSLGDGLRGTYDTAGDYAETAGMIVTLTLASAVSLEALPRRPYDI